MGASIPQVEDMNNDGHLDIVVSNYLCDIMYYEGNGTDSFAEFKRFKLEDGSELTYTEENQQNQINARNPSRTYGAVKLHDWDEDGFIDILFTSNHIGVTVFINTGNDGVPVFKLGEEIKVNDQEIRYDRPSIDVFDINCDGAKDLVMGMNKKGTYILNSGTNKAPEFSEIHDLYVEDSIKIEMDGVTANPIHGEIQVNVADWNSDGYPDLIVGENCGWTISPPFEKAYLFLGKPDGTVDVTSPAATPKSTAISIGVVGKKVSYKLPESGTTTLTLYSLRGRKIAEHSLDHAIDGVIELSDIANGSYIVQMQSNNIVHRQIINLF